MALQKQPSIIFRKVRFRACLPDTTVSRGKQVSQSPEDINWLVSMWAAKSQKAWRFMQTNGAN